MVMRRIEIGQVKRRNKHPHLWVHLVLIIASILFVIPILYVISISVTSDSEIISHGYRLIPQKISVLAYEYIFKTPKQLLNSYSVSIFITVVGTGLSLTLTTMLAYMVSRPDFKYRKQMSFFIFFTMLFNGGLVPTYMLITQYLHLKNTIWVLILPYVINAWFVLLMRSFLSTIPMSLLESAQIDGSSEIQTFFLIVMPLSKPALATIGLLISFNYWNDWWLSMLYIDERKLLPLQYMLYKIMSDIEFLTQQMSANVNVSLKDIPSEAARMATCILAAGPMLLVFPFFQKYFVKGLTVGAIKE